MKRDYEDYLNNIIEAINLIEEFTEGMEFEDFQRDRKTQFAVIRALEIIGEATKNIAAEFQYKHPEVPWSEMARMRDKLIHAYFGVDLRVVWRTVKEDIPLLKRLLGRLV
ncbi:HepT-like ribonuclease domain-containing protein [Thermococcus sp.]